MFSNIDLKTEMFEYAARDAFGSMLILVSLYDTLMTPTEILSPLVSESPSSTISSHSMESILTEKRRVLLDPFHAMNRVLKTISIAHPSRIQFCHDLRMSIFTIDQTDEALVRRKLLEGTGKDNFDQYNQFNPEWIHKRCRRKIGSPEMLKESLLKLQEVYSSNQHKDSNNNPLLTKETKKEISKLIENHLNCISDPKNIPLYFRCGEDNLGIPLYRCIRGTNSVESYHQWLEKMFTPWCQGPKLSDAVFTLLRHVWNARASEKHRPGFPKIGHTEYHIIDNIQIVTEKLFGQPAIKWWRPSITMECTGETFGIVPTVLSNEYQMVENCDVSEMSESMQFLVRKLKLKIPFLHVVTLKEKLMFRKAIQSGKYDDGTSTNFEAMADDWNSGKLGNVICNTKVRNDQVFKKTASQLEAFFKLYSKTSASKSQGVLTRANITELAQGWDDNAMDIEQCDVRQAIPLRDFELESPSSDLGHDTRTEIGMIPTLAPAQGNSELNVPLLFNQFLSFLETQQRTHQTRRNPFVFPPNTIAYDRNHITTTISSQKKACKQCSKDTCPGYSLLT